MHKLIFTVAVIVGLGAGLVMAVGSFLAIDDLQGCGERPDPLIGACAPADAIVAISGGDTMARTREAIVLYKAGWAPQLIFSGAALDTSGPSNAEAMRAIAIQQGVPPGDITIDTLAVDTAANASNTAILLDTDVRRLILVTSPYHQRRAAAEFTGRLGNNVTVVSHPTPYDRSWTSAWWSTPQGWWLALGEVIKTSVVVLQR